MKDSMMAGIVVQNISISCLSGENRLVIFVVMFWIISHEVIAVTAVMIIIEWSWKNSRCSMIGDFLFWKLIFIHIGIRKFSIEWVD